MNNQHLVFNNAYAWHTNQDVSFKGFFFDQDGRFFESTDAAKQFAGVRNMKQLKDICAQIDGSWSVVINKRGKTLAACDPMGMFPLFYARSGPFWLLSDSSSYLADKVDGASLNHQAELEFLSAGFVLGRETLIEQVYRVKPGELICLDHAPQMPCEETDTWHYFLPEAFSRHPEEQLREEFTTTLQEMTARLLSSVKGKTLVVPLSGGFDSRLIACLLKMAGAEEVVCLTYGRPNPEAELSRRVAKKLGYQWLFADYTNIHTAGFLDDPVFAAYHNYAGNHTSMPYLQEYFAVKHLKEEGLVPGNSIFLPGHSGDYLGGSYVGRTIRMACSWNDIHRHIGNHYFPFIPHNKIQKNNLAKRIRCWLNGYDPPACATDPDYCVYVEDWDVKEKLAKFIFNSASVFPFFGYGVRFPLWDQKLRRFFREVPFPQRLHKRLYDEVIIKNCFQPLGVYFGDEELTGASHGSMQRFTKGPIKQVGKLARRWLPFPLMEQRLKKRDWICYSMLTGEMARYMHEKGISMPRRYNSYNALICAWYIQKTSELCLEAGSNRKSPGSSS